jgi:sugar phosphate isomerase/epimerase
MHEILISSIAWDPELDLDVVKILTRNNIQKIDLVPAKYFPDRLNVTKEDILKVKDYWAEHNLSILGFQSLFFKEEPMNLFGPKEEQDKMLRLLERLAFIGEVLKAPYFVFGSPRNRDRSKLTDSDTVSIAMDFFYKLGELSKSHGTIFCLEPNPPVYGANFLTTTKETGEFVRALNHPNIKLQVDTGAMEINQEDPLAILKEYHKEAGHIHLSTDQIRPLTETNCRYTLYKEAFSTYLDGKPISIEILPKEGDDRLGGIEESIVIAKQWFFS